MKSRIYIESSVVGLRLPQTLYPIGTFGELIMWTDTIVAYIHKIRADITARARDNSHALTLEAQRMAQEAAEKYGMRWQSAAPTPRPSAVVTPA
jgi:hypothetical protein